MRTSSFAIVLLATSSAISNLALAQSTDVRPSLEKTADCMLDVLKAMPEVSEPKLGVATTEGWTHPFLEYRAAEALSRYYPIRFEAKKSERGGFWFLAVKSGLGAPEFHITDAVIQKMEGTVWCRRKRAISLGVWWPALRLLATEKPNNRFERSRGRLFGEPRRGSMIGIKRLCLSRRTRVAQPHR
jgi:hypothetical protein